MSESIQESIVAIVTTNKDQTSSGAPVFIAQTNESLQQMSQTISHVMDASSHEIDKQTIILVKR